jgi:hypothetical protein
MKSCSTKNKELFEIMSSAPAALQSQQTQRLFIIATLSGRVHRVSSTPNTLGALAVRCASAATLLQAAMNALELIM